ncbi:hypothetical protein ACH4TV_46545 [Streptomyces sp. NPDC020898]|uniref:hypothetical protein n=1 Tax=Streptomyces sp. NPDC020898 TaxID=3365101 RepID=UPI0037B982DE
MSSVSGLKAAPQTLIRRQRRGPLHELQLDGRGRHVADGHQSAGGVGRGADPALW